MTAGPGLESAPPDAAPPATGSAFVSAPGLSGGATGGRGCGRILRARWRPAVIAVGGFVFAVVCPRRFGLGDGDFPGQHTRTGA